MTLLALACLAGSGCAAPPPPRPVVAPAPPAIPPPDPAMQLPVSTAQVPIELHPRAEIRDTGDAKAKVHPASLVLTLPLDRAALRKVAVHLTVKRRSNGEVVGTQDLAYDRLTTEPVLTVPLPDLRNGVYEAEVRSAADIDILDEDWTVVIDKKEGTETLPFSVGAVDDRQKSFEFHFEASSATPVKAERKMLDAEVAKIAEFLGQHQNAAVRVECWASTEGAVKFNSTVAQERCDWFRGTVWSRFAWAGKPAEFVVHGSTDVPSAPLGKRWQPQILNRLVRLGIRWTE